MKTILVVATANLRVPLENNPHQYIEQEPVAVDADNLYYRRLLADGDLLVIKDKPTAKSKGA